MLNWTAAFPSAFWSIWLGLNSLAELPAFSCMRDWITAAIVEEKLFYLWHYMMGCSWQGDFHIPQLHSNIVCSPLLLVVQRFMLICTVAGVFFNRLMFSRATQPWTGVKWPSGTWRVRHVDSHLRDLDLGPVPDHVVPHCKWGEAWAEETSNHSLQNSKGKKELQ